MDILTDGPRGKVGYTAPEPVSAANGRPGVTSGSCGISYHWQMAIIGSTLALASVALLCMNAAEAAADGDPPEERFALTPVVAYVSGGTFEDDLTGQELELENSGAVGLQLNVRVDAQSTWEVQYVRQDTETSTALLPAVKVTVDKLEIGGTYEVNTARTRPYVAATIGASRFDPKDSGFKGDTYFSFSLGGGFRFLTDRPVGLSLDFRWLGAVINEDTDVFCLSADGLTCLIQADAGLTSQFRVLLGLNVRF